MITDTIYNRIKNDVLHRLETELDKRLVYHAADHTLDVMQAAETLCKHEQLNTRDRFLTGLAALLHDAGYLETYDDHETASANMARAILPGYGLDDEEIDMICSAIMATAMPQKAGTVIAKIVADADLDYLGRDDLFMVSQRLHYEWKLFGKVYSLRAWHELQLEFLETHSYFTSSAHRLRDKGKEKNISELRELLFKSSGKS
ncbi:MAG: hypothetical protein Kow00127_08810 [Bacteroidales bacterium]